MKILTCAAAAVAAALLAASPGTAGKGGPTPDPLGGWDGVVSASGAVRYVALPGRGTTTVAGVRVADGRVLRYATVPGLLGIPQVTWDGKTTGSGPTARADARLDHEAPARPSETTYVVLRANSLGFTPDGALGHSYWTRSPPTGSTIYAVQYTDLSHYSVRAIDTVERTRARPRRSSTSASPRGDARLADDARVGAWPYLGIHALRKADR